MIKQFPELIERFEKKNMIVIQVGVWKGESLLQYLPIVKKNDGMIYAVDYFEGNPTATGEHGYAPENSDSIYSQFVNNIQSAGFSDYVVTIMGNSTEVHVNIPNGIADIVFIDGDHRYSIINQDISNYLPKVKVGGVMCGHDYNAAYIHGMEYSEDEMETDTHLGVSRAVYEHFNTDFEIVDGDVWIHMVND
jgi:hypothetical protein